MAAAPSNNRPVCSGCESILLLDKALACSTCDDFGLDPAWFCTQQCFLKNVEKHSLLHMLRRKRILSDISSTPFDPTDERPPAWVAALASEEYAWLLLDRDDSSLQKHAFLRLPHLAGNGEMTGAEKILLPKLVESTDFMETAATKTKFLNFFFTADRHELLRQLKDFSRRVLSNEDRSWNIAPAGPQGVGKSIFCYMIAAFAAVNRFPLLYIPNVRLWTIISTTVTFQLRLIRTFLQQNWHWLRANPEHKARDLNKWWADQSVWLKTEHGVSQLAADCELLLGFFQTGFAPKTPQFIILDEHNALFKRVNGEKVENLPMFWDPFLGWDFAGILVLSGSSHSLFLRKIENTEAKVKALQPFSEEEARAFLADPLSPAYINDLADGAATAIVDWYGCVPRVLTQLVRHMKEFHLSIEDVVRDKPVEFFALSNLRSRFQRYCDGHLNVRFYRNRFLEVVEGALFNQLREFNPPQFGEEILDPGLFYRDSLRVLRPINQYAINLVLQKYCEILQQQIITSVKATAVKAHLFEKLVLAGLLTGGCLEFHSLFQSKETMLVQPFQPSRLLSFDGQNMAQAELHLFQNAFAGATIFNPIYERFPHIDYFVLDSAHTTVYLLQVTLSTPAIHLKSPGNDWLGFFDVPDLQVPKMEYAGLLADQNVDIAEIPGAGPLIPPAAVATQPESPGTKASSSSTDAGQTQEENEDEDEDEEEYYPRPEDLITNSWDLLCDKLGISKDTIAHYIYITLTKKSETRVRARPAALPQNVLVSYLPFESLSKLKIPTN